MARARTNRSAVRRRRRGTRGALALTLLGVLCLGAVAVAVAWPGAGDERRGSFAVALRPLPAPAHDCDRRIQSRAFFVADAGGRTLAAHRPAARRAVGSITKLMTAHLLLRAGGLEREVTVPPVRLGADESSAGLVGGERLSRDELLRALLVPSGNDAAETVAATTGAGRREFIRAMNREARRLGLNGTTYANPSGMPVPGQSSTARDSVRLARKLMGDVRFRRIVRLRSTRVGDATLPTRNTLLGRARGVDGVKTGTLAGDWSMVASARGPGGRVYAAVLGAPGPEARDRDAHCLLTLGRRLNG